MTDLQQYDDPQLRKKASGYRKLATDQLVEVHIHLASRQAVQSDYQGALKTVNQALAIDPKNEEALSMRSRIEEYSSQGWGWRPWI